MDKLGYEAVKTYLNIANYDYYLKIEANGALLFESGQPNDVETYIQSDYSTKDTRIAYSRAVKYANKIGRMTLVLYG